MAKMQDGWIWTDKKRTIFGLPISFTRYILTETKFITRRGFLNIEEDEMDLYKITDKKLVLKLGQRIFGCGSIVIDARDTDSPVKTVKSIKEPRKFLALLDEKIVIQRDKYRVRGRDMMGVYSDEVFDNDDNN